MPSATRKPKAGRNVPRSASQPARLDTFTKMLLGLGVFGAVLLALALGLLMSTLRSSSSTPGPDPDAQTPVILPDHPRGLIDFALTDQLNRTITRADLRHKIVLVDFLFTSCSITCPYVNAQMQKIQDATAGDPRVRLLSLTLDPEDDTVSVLNQYAKGFGADPARWSFLTGDAGQMRKLIGTSFLAQDTTGEFSYMPGNFANTQRMVLLDPSGQVVCYFDGLNQNAADSALAKIHQLESSR